MNRPHHHRPRSPLRLWHVRRGGINYPCRPGDGGMDYPCRRAATANREPWGRGVCTTWGLMMIVAYHSIFCGYGFWLPNDPRGSWSDFVGSWELFCAAGPATTCDARRSLATRRHNAATRAAGKLALVYPPMRFNPRQIASIAVGFARVCTKTGCSVLACAIMPDHVHIVIRRHPRMIESLVAHLKSRATKGL